MKILLTRPDYDGQKTQNILEDYGFESFNHPFLTVKPKPFDVPVENVQGYIFTSKNGVRSACDRVDNKDLPCFVVGKETSLCAEDHGFSNVLMADGNVDSLIKLFNSQHTVLTLLYCRGNHITADLKTISTHHHIEEVITYETETVLSWSSLLTEKFLNEEFTHIVFASVRTIQSFIKSVETHSQKENIKNILSRTTILFFGNPMVEYAGYLNARNYIILPEASIQGLINILENEKRNYGKNIKTTH